MEPFELAKLQREIKAANAWLERCRAQGERGPLVEPPKPEPPPDRPMHRRRAERERIAELCRKRMK
jgi:hypothetical protein